MRAFKDNKDGYYEYEGVDIPEWATNFTPCEIIPFLSKIQLKNNEIKERLNKYKLDLKELQFSWLTASITDGISEDAKKNAILIEMSNLKSEYDLDVIAIKNKYL